MVVIYVTRPAETLDLYSAIVWFTNQLPLRQYPLTCLVNSIRKWVRLSASAIFMCMWIGDPFSNGYQLPALAISILNGWPWPNLQWPLPRWRWPKKLVARCGFRVPGTAALWCHYGTWHHCTLVPLWYLALVFAPFSPGATALHCM